MKFSERKKYYGLAILESGENERPFICGNCKYFRSYYDYEYGNDAECIHPLERVHDINFGYVNNSGSNCWGFRPLEKFDESKISIKEAEKAVDDFFSKEISDKDFRL